MKLEELIVPVDFSDCSRAAVARATTLATHYRAPLHLLHAVPPIPYAGPAEFGIPSSVLDGMEARAAAKLEEWARQITASEAPVSHQVSRLRAVDAICAAANTRRAPLIVMGTHGYSGLRHALLGSVAERTLRVAPCPVMAVKEDASVAGGAIRRVLLCTDFSVHAKRATEIAISLCRDLGAELHLAHALHLQVPAYAELSPPQQFLLEARNAAERRLDQVKRRVDEAGLEGSVNLVEGEPSTEIAELAKLHGLDLIVMGTRGATGLRHVVLGSVAERVLRQLPCSVLVAKAADWEGA